MLVCCIKQKTLSSSVIVVGGGRGDEDEDDKREGREGERQCTLVCISARLHHPRQFTKPDPQGLFANIVTFPTDI